MPFYYFLQNWKQAKPLGRPVLVIVLALLVFGGIRYCVLQGQNISYDKISGVGPSHIMENLRRLNDWPRQFLFSIGIFLPFLFIGHRKTNTLLRDLAIFLVITLFVSNLVFSWLAEARNFVPAAFPLIVIAANGLVGGAATPGSTVDSRRENEATPCGQNR